MFESLLQPLRGLFGDQLWLGLVVLVMLVVVAINVFSRLFFKQLRAKTENTKNPWDDAFVVAIQRPLAITVWILGLSVVAEIIVREKGDALFELGTPLRSVGIALTMKMLLFAFTLVSCLVSVEASTLLFQYPDPLPSSQQETKQTFLGSIQVGASLFVPFTQETQGNDFLLLGILKVWFL